MIAQWYFDQWGHLGTDNSVRKIEKELQQYCNIESLPLMLVASKDDRVLGTAQLKFREMSIYPEKEHWLGGVYVDSSVRGKGIAVKIIAEVERIARSFDVKTLYLQTEDLTGGLYKKLAWQVLEQVNYRGLEVLVMEKNL